LKGPQPRKKGTEGDGVRGEHKGIIGEEKSVEKRGPASDIGGLGGEGGYQGVRRGGKWRKSCGRINVQK